MKNRNDGLNRLTVFLTHNNNEEARLLFSWNTNNEDVNDVIKFINEKRDTCFMKNKEKKQILIFNDFIESSRIIYGKKEKIDVYLKRQDDILFGDDSEKFGYVPRIITA